MAPKVLLVLVGSLGDVLPFLALGEALRRGPVGWNVTVAAHPEFEARIQTDHPAFGFAKINKSIVRELRDTPAGEAMRTAGVFTAFSASRTFFTPLLHSWCGHGHAAPLRHPCSSRPHSRPGGRVACASAVGATGRTTSRPRTRRASQTSWCSPPCPPFAASGASALRRL